MNLPEMAQYRLAQASETLDEAIALKERGLWRGVINRSYYAMFYTILALAVEQDKIAAKHTAAISFFDREYVKTGIFPKEFSKALHLLFDRRQSNDYGEIWEVDEDEALQALQDATNFVQAIKTHLGEK
jgi:uncharacterized protein (UPF0332 family)